MDLSAKLDEIIALVEDARAMPMSASCIVNRDELLAGLDELRQLLPAEMAEAQRVLAERSAVVADGQAEAERIVAAARAERAKLLARSEVVREATAQAEEMLAAARADVERMRAEIDDYVDGKLANFEVVLHKTLQAVEKGRAKINGRHDLELGESFDEERVLAD